MSTNKFYVTEHGNWGGDEFLVVDETDLTSKQWRNLEVLHDKDRLPYAKAILAGEDVSEYEEDPSPWTEREV